MGISINMAIGINSIRFRHSRETIKQIRKHSAHFWNDTDNKYVIKGMHVMQ